MSKINIALNDKNRSAVIDILSTLLADENVLLVKTRNFHWNVVGPQFNDLHKFFEAQYEELADVVDDVAERSRALGGNSVATLSEFLKLTRLKEHPGQYPPAPKMIADLLEDHETIIRHLRADAETVGQKNGDAGTNDFLVGLMEQHEKMAWMLRSFLD